LPKQRFSRTQADGSRLVLDLADDVVAQVAEHRELPDRVRRYRGSFEHL
jgi:hypothetical protein